MGESMKKLLMIAAVLVLLLTVTACGEDPAPAAPTEPAETQAPTDAPYIDTQIDEPEWTLAEGELQLEGEDDIYAESDDVLYFAIITNPDGTQELRFRLTDEIADTLLQQDPDNVYYMTLDGIKIGEATLNDRCTVVTITEEDAVGEITALASKIRGLAE